MHRPIVHTCGDRPFLLRGSVSKRQHDCLRFATEGAICTNFPDAMRQTSSLSLRVKHCEFARFARNCIRQSASTLLAFRLLYRLTGDRASLCAEGVKCQAGTCGSFSLRIVHLNLSEHAFCKGSQKPHLTSWNMAGQTFNDSRIDRSVGLLLLGLVVSGFFFLAIFGMQSVQRNATKIAEEPPKVDAAQPVYDLGS